MQTLILIVLAVLAMAFANPAVLTEDQYQGLFSRFVSQYEKNYEMKEFFPRYNTFKDNLNYIIAHNSKETETYKLAINHFGDFTEEEYKNTMLKYTRSPVKVDSIEDADPNVTAPSEIDWRSKGKVTSVKNQGQCGSCWAFTTTASTESVWAIKKNQLIDLSEQQLVDCAKPYGTNGCNGGSLQGAFNYIAAHGLCKLNDYQYTAKLGNCRGCNAAAHTNGFTGVAGNEDAIAQAVAKNPVSVALDAAPKGFMFYSSGVFGGDCGTQLDHGVTIVGYKPDYWIIKNSWGSGWGQGGYIYLKRGKNQCGVNEDVNYPYIN